MVSLPAEQAANLRHQIQILSKCFDREKCEWDSPENERTWKELNARYDRVMAEVEQEGRLQQIARDAAGDDQTGLAGPLAVNQATDPRYRARGTPGSGRLGRTAATGHVFKDNHGNLIQAFRYGEPMTPAGQMQVGEESHYIGRRAMALLTGDHESYLSDREIRNQNSGLTDSAGGVFLEPVVSSRTWDLARSESRMLEAGVQTLNVNDRQTKLVRVVSDPTSDWKAELESMFYSEAGFDHVMVEPKKIIAIVPVSYELAADSANAARVIEQTLVRHMGWAIDNVILNGTGTNNEPTGILADSNVPETPTVGVPADYTNITRAVTVIRGANCHTPIESMSWVLNPTDMETYANLVDTTNQPLMMTPWISGINRLEATGMPAGNMVVGDYSETYLCVRNRLRLQRFDTGSAQNEAQNATVNALTDLAFFLRVYARIDVVSVRPTWLHKLSGVTTPP